MSYCRNQTKKYQPLLPSGRPQHAGRRQERCERPARISRWWTWHRPRPAYLGASWTSSIQMRTQGTATELLSDCSYFLSFVSFLTVQVPKQATTSYNARAIFFNLGSSHGICQGGQDAGWKTGTHLIHELGGWAITGGDPGRAAYLESWPVRFCHEDVGCWDCIRLYNKIYQVIPSNMTVPYCDTYSISLSFGSPSYQRLAINSRSTAWALAKRPWLRWG